MMALGDFTLPLLIRFSDLLQIPSSLTILIVRIVWGHLKDDPPQENNIKGLGNLRIQRKRRDYIGLPLPFTLFTKAH